MTSVAAALATYLRAQPLGTPLLGTPNTTSSADHQPFHWMSYDEVADASAALSAGLKQMNIPRRASVVIASKNCPEWLITDFACAFGDFMSVGVHISWPVAKLSAVLLDTNALAIVVSSAALPHIQQALTAHQTKVKLVVVIDIAQLV